MMKVILKAEEYVRLKNSEANLERLYAGGVDKWEWYDDSLDRDDDFPLITIDDIPREMILSTDQADCSNED